MQNKTSWQIFSIVARNCWNKSIGWARQIAVGWILYVCVCVWESACVPGMVWHIGLAHLFLAINYFSAILDGHRARELKHIFHSGYLGKYVWKPENKGRREIVEHSDKGPRRETQNQEEEEEEVFFGIKVSNTRYSQFTHSHTQFHTRHTYRLYRSICRIQHTYSDTQS